jgi:hypothetical protein
MSCQKNFGMLFLILGLLSISSLWAGQETGFRPPAVPLVVHDPCFSIWSVSDRLSDDWTKHWTGKPHALMAMLRIDGKTYRIMGREPRGGTRPICWRLRRGNMTPSSSAAQNLTKTCWRI